MTPAEHHAHALRQHRVSLPFHPYHVVKCLDGKRSFRANLTTPDLGEIVVQALLHQRDRHGCRLFAFVVMPDHVHWFFALPEESALSERVKVLCNWTALRINRHLCETGRLWQKDGFYDHLVREDDKVTELIGYIENNPVRKGLCDRPEEWEWSSAHMRWKDHLDRDWFGPERY